ncbi:MAG: winged helix-turn-helix domain-containing protein [Parasphingorhabdus sp.]
MPDLEKAPPRWSEARKISIGEIIVDIPKNQLVMGKQVHQLEPRLVRVLLILCENAGEVVSREALLSAVSALPYAGDESLTQAISKLRTMLGDKPKSPKYIKTIPRQGYLLLTPAEIIDQPVQQVAIDNTGTTRKKILGGAILLVIIIAALAYNWPDDNGDTEFIEKKNIEFIERE